MRFKHHTDYVIIKLGSSKKIIPKSLNFPFELIVLEMVSKLIEFEQHSEEISLSHITKHKIYQACLVCSFKNAYVHLSHTFTVL